MLRTLIIKGKLAIVVKKTATIAAYAGKIHCDKNIAAVAYRNATGSISHGFFSAVQPGIIFSKTILSLFS